MRTAIALIAFYVVLTMAEIALWTAAAHAHGHHWRHWAHGRASYSAARVYVPPKAVKRAGGPPRVLVGPSQIGSRFFVGQASHYGAGDGFDGKRTACGTRFSQYALTAASPWLKCFQIVQVVNKANGKHVDLTITDVGPARRTGRVLDVSSSAASILGFRAAGTATVDVQVLN